MTKAIWAQDANGVIGQNGKLPWHLSEELKHFKQETEGNTLVMGRKTYESIPGKLSNRHIIVLTRDKDFKPKHDNVYVANQLFDVYIIKRELQEQGHDVGELIIAGGSSIYELFDGHIDQYIISLVDDVVTGDNLDCLPTSMILKSNEIQDHVKPEIRDGFKIYRG